MAFSINWVPDEPVLVATGTGAVTGQDFEVLFDDASALIQAVDGKIYCVADCLSAESSFKDVMASLKFIAEKSADAMSNARLQICYVGTSQWVSHAVSALEQTPGGKMVQTFASVEDALSYIHRENSKYNGATGFLTNSDYFHRINSKDWNNGT